MKALTNYLKERLFSQIQAAIDFEPIELQSWDNNRYNAHEKLYPLNTLFLMHT